MKEMGMTDSQFKSYIRFVLDDLEEAKKLTTEPEVIAKLQKIIDNMQRSLED